MAQLIARRRIAERWVASAGAPWFESSRSIHLFFFQAEDGIRDLTVTGVQTCALPISLTGGRRRRAAHARPRRPRGLEHGSRRGAGLPPRALSPASGRARRGAGPCRP